MNNSTESGVVTLWDLLMLVSGSSAFTGAMLATDVLGQKSMAIAVGVALGLPLGALSIYAIRAVTERLMEYLLTEDPSPRTDIKMALVFLMAIVWIPVSSVLCFQITRTVIMGLAHVGVSLKKSSDRPHCTEPLRDD